MNSYQYFSIKALIERYDDFDVIKPILDNISNEEKCQVLSFSSRYYKRFDIFNYILKQFAEDGFIPTMSENTHFKEAINQSYEKYLFTTLDLITKYIPEKINLELFLNVFDKTLESCFQKTGWNSFRANFEMSDFIQSNVSKFEKYMSEYKDVMKELPTEKKIKIVYKISEINDSDYLFFNNDLYEFLDKIKSDYNEYSIENKKEMNRLFISTLNRENIQNKKLIINYLKKFLYADDFFVDSEFKYLNKFIKTISLKALSTVNLNLLSLFKEQIIKIKPFLKNIDSIDYLINHKELIVGNIKKDLTDEMFEKIKDDLNGAFIYLKDFKKQISLENKTNKLSLKKLK